MVFIQENASDNPSQFKSILHNSICEMAAISSKAYVLTLLVLKPEYS